VWHAQLGVHTFYAHLAQHGVQAGQDVAAGELLGAVGSTGYSTGAHLHLEIRIAIPSGEYSQTAPLSNGRCDPETWAALLGLALE
jgi:murein DD-endopeptidase MepM/ murein hydrolase activator NlpD